MTARPSAEPQSRVRHNRGILRVDVDLLHRMFCLPDDVEIVNVATDFTAAGVLRFLVQGPRLPPTAFGDRVPELLPVYRQHNCVVVDHIEGLAP